MNTYLFIFVSLIAYECILSLPVDKKLKTDHLPNANQKVEEEIDNLVCSAFFNLIIMK